MADSKSAQVANQRNLPAVTIGYAAQLICSGGWFYTFQNHSSSYCAVANASRARPLSCDPVDARSHDDLWCARPHHFCRFRVQNWIPCTFFVALICLRRLCSIPFLHMISALQVSMYKTWARLSRQQSLDVRCPQTVRCRSCLIRLPWASPQPTCPLARCS